MRLVAAETGLSSEITLACLCSEAARIAFPDDPGVLEHIDTVGMRKRERHVLLAQQHRDVGGLSQPLERFREGLQDDRGESQRRLVEDQDLRLHHQGAADRQHLLLAAGQRLRHLALPLLEDREQIEQPFELLLLIGRVEMLAADGYLLGTPANLGYVSGALKHAFDCAYYQLLDSTRGRPFGLYLHGNEGTEGAERAVDTITTGLGWSKAAATVIVSGKPSKDELQACWELGATVAAQLMD